MRRTRAIRIPRLVASGAAALVAGIAVLTVALLFALAAAPVGGALGPSQASAQAAVPNGTLSIEPATGSDVEAISATTSGGCTEPGADAYDAFAIGPVPFGVREDSPFGVLLVGTTSDTSFSTDSPIRAPFRINFNDLASELGAVDVPAGDYRVTLRCTDGVLGTVFQTYTTTLTFTTPTSYTWTSGGGGPSPPGTGTLTTTTLAVTPPTPVASGTASTLTATVTPATATGTVQFRNGTTPVGSPVPVAGGTATAPATLPTGTNSLTAVFTGTAGSFMNSTSTVVAYVVNASGAVTTTTTLTTTPASPVTVGTAVTVRATVTPATAAGTVQFTDGTSPVGVPVAVSGGTASTVVTPTATGTRTLTAAFTPTVATAFTASTSGALSLVANAAGVATPSRTATTAPTTSAPAGQGGGSGGTLAYTGAPVAELFVAGLVLTALGAALLLTARRRRLV